MKEATRHLFALKKKRLLNNISTCLSITPKQQTSEFSENSEVFITFSDFRPP